MGIPGIFLVPIVVENNSFFVASLFFLILTIPCIISIHLLGKCIRIENEAKEKKLELKNSNMDMGQFAVLVEELDEEDEKESYNVHMHCIVCALQPQFCCVCDNTS